MKGRFLRSAFFVEINTDDVLSYTYIKFNLFKYK